MSKIHPIVCRACGSRNIEFITEYHKCVWLRFFKNLCSVLFWVTLVIALLPTLSVLLSGAEMDTEALIKMLFADIPFLACGIGYLVFGIIVFFKESKTHVQAICRDCGEIWRLN